MTGFSILDPLMHRLGWALIHFVWQGALVAVVLKLMLGLLRRRSANLRYLAACGAMLCLVASPIVTGLTLPSVTPPSLPQTPTLGAHSLAPEGGGHDEDAFPAVIVRVFVGQRASVAVLRRWIEAALPALLLLWMAGVTLCSLRLYADWCAVRHLSKSGSPLATAEWNRLLSRISERLRVRPRVRLVQSALVEVPTALGWLRPIVLLPASTLSGLSPGQLEAIVAHELAHIRRHDYLVNLLQSIAETWLFYHPAVWWVSAQMRHEREDCCDDLVVASYGDAAGYAQALARLEALRAVPPSLACGASGGSLLMRVRRLLGQPSSNSSSGVWVMGVIIGLLVCLWFAGKSDAFAETQQRLPHQVQAAFREPPRVTRPAFAVDPDTGSPIVIDPEAPKLFTRTYKVDPGSFIDGMSRLAAQGTAGEASSRSDLPSTIRAHMARIGVQFPAGSVLAAMEQGLPAPRGKTIFFNHRTGLLLVRATLEELDTIETALTTLPAAPVVEIEIKFVELADADIQAIGLKTLLSVPDQDSAISVTNRTGRLGESIVITNLCDLFAPDALQGIQKVTLGTRGTLSDAQFRTVQRDLEQRPGAKVLAAPRVTTLSSRQARVEVMDLRNIVTSVTLGENTNRFNTTAIPFGPSVDVIPYVSADRQTIQMTLIPGLTSFAGYGDEGAVESGTVHVQKPLPRIRASHTITSAVVPDGHTLVLTGFESSTPAAKGEPASSTPVILFVTPTIIHSTVNRLHPK